jgi:hypothetical protein
VMFTAGTTRTDTAVAPAPLPAGATKYEVSLGYYRFSLLREGKSYEAGINFSWPDSQHPSLLHSAILLVFPQFDNKFKRFSDLPDEAKVELLTHGFFARMPYVIFFMVPVFALFLKLLYLPSRRPYGEYLLFALHVNAFAFFIMALMHACPWAWGEVALAVILMLYIGRAMHNVYGGAALATLARWLVLGLAYLLTLTMLIVQVMQVLAVTSV